MKLKELKSILENGGGHYIQSTILWEQDTNTDLENGASIEYVIKHYGERKVKNIRAFENSLVITI